MKNEKLKKGFKIFQTVIIWLMFGFSAFMLYYLFTSTRNLLTEREQKIQNAIKWQDSAKIGDTVFIIKNITDSVNRIYNGDLGVIKLVNKDSVLISFSRKSIFPSSMYK